MNGCFITFEGIEGCGKTTQICLLDEYLQKKGYVTVLTREPGGTIIGDKIRQILLDPQNKMMHPICELLLYAAARDQHLEELIKPALHAGKIVLCDRYADSTTAYQGAARRLDVNVLKSLHKIATGGLDPHLTILLDMPATEGLLRAKKRGASDRFENEKIDFHKKVREGYLAIATAEPKRVKIVDAARPIDVIHRDIIGLINTICR